MKLQRLRLVNFRQHADTEIAFGDGITGIIGPNGSGKTSLLEAIAWAIYGNPAARGDKDSIRNLRAKARAPVRVELEFGLGSHAFRVERGLNNAELSLAEPGDSGVSAALDDFWTSWSSLQQSSDLDAAKQTVISKGEAVADALQSVRSQMVAAQQDAQGQYDSITGPQGVR